MPVKAKLSQLLEHFDSPSEEFRSFFNRSTGEVVLVSNDDLARAEDEEEEEVDSEGLDDESFQEALAIIEDEEDQYVDLPDQYEIDEYSFMEGFCYAITDPKNRNSLQLAIKGKGAFRRFKDMVRDFGIEDQWYDFREQKLKELAMEWCEDHEIPFIDDISPKNGEAPEKEDPRAKPDQEAPGGKRQVRAGRYRHFKGKEYEVIAVAKHSETLEEYVVYRALYGESDYWVRPKEMFLEKVTVDGKTVPRFEYIS